MTPATSLLSVPQVAQRLGVPASWVYAQVESPNSELPYIRVGRYIRFEPEDIEGYIAARRRGGKERP